MDGETFYFAYQGGVLFVGQDRGEVAHAADTDSVMDYRMQVDGLKEAVNRNLAAGNDVVLMFDYPAEEFLDNGSLWKT